MSENEDNQIFPKKIQIKIEPVEEPIEVTVDAKTTVQEIIEQIVKICKEKNIDISGWAKQKLGTEKFSLVFMRK